MGRLRRGGCEPVVDHLTPSSSVSLVRCADGLPALAPAGRNGDRSRLRIRRGSRIYFLETVAAFPSGPERDTALGATPILADGASVLHVGVWPLTRAAGMAWCSTWSRGRDRRNVFSTTARELT